MHMKISVNCASCGEEIVHNVWCQDGIVPLAMFEGNSFECEHCGKTSYTGDMEVLSEDDI